MPTFTSGPNNLSPNLPPEVAVQRLDAARLKAGLSIYELGEELRRVFLGKAYLKYADSWVEFLKARKLPGRTTCAKLMRIVEECPRETLLKKGIEWCFGRLRFSTLGEQLRNAGVPIDLMYDGDPDEMTAAQLTEANKQLRALLLEAHDDDIEPGTDVKRTPPPPRTPKTKEMSNLQRGWRGAGADHVIFSNFMKHGTMYARIQVPIDQLDIILRPLPS